MKTTKKVEQDFHDQSFSFNTRASIYKYYAISRRARDCYLREILDGCEDKLVLEYGCGSDGSDAFTLARSGAKVFGIDISPVAVSQSIAMAKKECLEDKASFFVEDAEELSFPANHFDIIVGSGILHHLDLEKSIKEICRVTRNGAKVVFIEPLAYNPILNIYRILTPSLRTKTEHPLTYHDLKLINQYFESVELHFFCFTSLFASCFISNSLYDTLLCVLESIDDYLFTKFPFTCYLAWQVIILAKNPVRI
jgi:SAM-dependent methyltransferase